MSAWICTPATDRDLVSGLSEVRRLKGGVRPLGFRVLFVDYFSKKCFWMIFYFVTCHFLFSCVFS